MADSKKLSKVGRHTQTRHLFGFACACHSPCAMFEKKKILEQPALCPPIQKVLPSRPDAAPTVL
jgi:hypothetical protein